MGLIEEREVSVVILSESIFSLIYPCGEKTKQFGLIISTLYSYIIITFQNIYNYPLQTHSFSRIGLVSVFAV